MSSLVYGIGFNSRVKYTAKVNGKIRKSYDAWRRMLERCYCPKLHVRRPTYIGCTVAKEWYDYQVFAEWYENHVHRDARYQLDKDLLVPNNRVYSAESCCLIPCELNNILTDSRAARGDLPQGVSLKKESGRYSAIMQVNKKSTHLGYFDTPEEAHQVYKTAKERYVKNKALEWANRIEWDVFVALMNWELKPE